MSRTRLRTALVTTATAAALVVGGCGGSSDSGAAGDAKQITFQTWNLKNEKFTPYFTALISEFEKQNTGVKINWVDQPSEGYQDKLSADAAAGKLPDVVDMGPEAAYTLASAGVLSNLSKDDPSAQTSFLPKAWEAMTFPKLQGTFGYPWYLNTGPSFFNGALLQRCGLDPASPPQDYDQLFAAAKTMGTKCSDDAMLARLPAIENFGEYGVEVMNAEGTAFTFNNDRGVQFVQRYIDLYQSQGLTEQALNNLQTSEVTDFKAGKLAYLPGSSYTYNDLKTSAPTVFKSLAVTPRISNAAPNMYIESLVVNAGSKQPELARTFAKYVTNSANQLAFAKAASVFPSSAGTLDDTWFTKDDGDGATKVRLEGAKQVRTAVVWWPAAFSGSADVDQLREQIALAVLGKKSAKQALDDAAKYANDRLSASQ